MAADPVRGSDHKSAWDNAKLSVSRRGPSAPPDRVMRLAVAVLSAKRLLIWVASSRRSRRRERDRCSDPGVPLRSRDVWGVCDGCSGGSKRGSDVVADATRDVADAEADEGSDRCAVRRGFRILDGWPQRLDERAGASVSVAIVGQVVLVLR